MKYKLKLYDVRMVRNKAERFGKFDDKPLFYRRMMDEGAEWEFVEEFAHLFESMADAIELAAREHTRSPFEKADKLMLVDSTGVEVEITRLQLNESARVNAKRWAAEALAAAEAKAAEKKRHSFTERVKDLVGDVPSIVVDLHDEIACLTSGVSPDTMAT